MDGTLSDYTMRGQSLGAVTDERPLASDLALGNVSVAPRARARNAAMDVAEAMFAAAGRAERLAEIATKPWNPALINLRYRLFLYAACTRDPLLAEFAPEYRHRARNAIACYRALRRAA